MEKIDSSGHITAGYLLLMQTRGYKVLKRLQMFFLNSFFDPPEPQLSSITTKIGTEAENYQAYVNPLVKFCRQRTTLSRWSEQQAKSFTSVKYNFLGFFSKITIFMTSSNSATTF